MHEFLLGRISLFIVRNCIFTVEWHFLKVWIDKYGWKLGTDGVVHLTSQEDIIITRNISNHVYTVIRAV